MEPAPKSPTSPTAAAAQAEAKVKFQKFYTQALLQAHPQDVAIKVALKKCQDGSEEPKFLSGDIKFAAKGFEATASLEPDFVVSAFRDFYAVNMLCAKREATPTREDPCLDYGALAGLYSSLATAEGALPMASEAIAALADRVREQGPESLTEPGFLRFLVVAFEHPLFSGDPPHHEEMLKLCGVVRELPDASRETLAHWYAKRPVADLRLRLQAIQQCVTILLTLAEEEYDDFAEFSQETGPSTIAGLKWMSVLHRANELRKEEGRREKLLQKTPREVLAAEEFHNDAINDHEKIYKYDAVHALRRDPPLFGTCENHFVLDCKTKARLLQIESIRSQRTEAQNTIFEQISQIFRPEGGAGGMPVVNPFVVLKVHRDSLVQDTLQQLAHFQPHTLKRPLKVVFDGEEGIDEGGVQKEFFQLLLKELYNPEFGMFELDKDTRTFWFSKSSFEANLQYELFGVVLGLAMYNNALLDVHFPPVLWRKLTHKFGEVVAPEDLVDLNPQLAQSLAKLLKLPDDCNVEDLGLFFAANYEQFGATVTAELCPGGETKPVTKENVEEYVRLYAKWELHDSVEGPLRAFKRGFDKLGGQFTTLFQPEEVELLICGQPELDMGAWKAQTMYQDGFEETSDVAVWFWEIVLGEYGPEEHKALLHFTTGSDRAPVGGLEQLPLVISRMGPESERIPSAHTCFNHLLIPEYSSKEKLRGKLKVAIENSQGFGLM